MSVGLLEFQPKCRRSSIPAKKRMSACFGWRINDFSVFFILSPTLRRCAQGIFLFLILLHNLQLPVSMTLFFSKHTLKIQSSFLFRVWIGRKWNRHSGTLNFIFRGIYLENRERERERGDCFHAIAATLSLNELLLPQSLSPWHMVHVVSAWPCHHFLVSKSWIGCISCCITFPRVE